MDLQQVCIITPLKQYFESCVIAAICQSHAVIPWAFSPSPSFQIINVDWVHVESRAGDIAKSDKGVQLVLGQLIDEWVNSIWCVCMIWQPFNLVIIEKRPKLIVWKLFFNVQIIWSLSCFCYPRLNKSGSFCPIFKTFFVTILIQTTDYRDCRGRPPFVVVLVL